MVNNWLNIIQDYLLPPTCILCGNKGFESQDICKPCFISLKKNFHCCYRCAEIFETANVKSLLCGRCINQTPAFDETYAPFIYQDALRHLISTLKFKQQYKNARLLGFLLADYLQKTAELPELIIPVPLHKQRFRERGFNQSVEIAKSVSKHLKIPIDTQSCIRTRNTQHQIALPAKQRRSNMKNAFKVNQIIKAQHIAIIDDVMTTGSTVNDLAKTLKKSGVDRVDIWVCARA
ncbi:MAG: ComF family protein [Methylococcales symbiont of Hymedesmia sp. n. MRB-2018]|nr:MAG: ComF family protein [Methylococcales symbiont of Hymedesmia sp. n. MRB-2018]KAF3982928.1 MAG: ComF family protein [Methylococcales symbiont of Hymedesmia sp. n. MRB-2018]